MAELVRRHREWLAGKPVRPRANGISVPAVTGPFGALPAELVSLLLRAVLGSPERSHGARTVVRFAATCRFAMTVLECDPALEKEVVARIATSTTPRAAWADGEGAMSLQLARQARSRWELRLLLDARAANAATSISPHSTAVRRRFNEIEAAQSRNACSHAQVRDLEAPFSSPGVAVAHDRGVVDATHGDLAAVSYCKRGSLVVAVVRPAREPVFHSHTPGSAEVVRRHCVEERRAFVVQALFSPEGDRLAVVLIYPEDRNEFARVVVFDVLSDGRATLAPPDGHDERGLFSCAYAWWVGSALAVIDSRAGESSQSRLFLFAPSPPASMEFACVQTSRMCLVGPDATSVHSFCMPASSADGTSVFFVCTLTSTVWTELGLQVLRRCVVAHATAPPADGQPLLASRMHNFDCWIDIYDEESAERVSGCAPRVAVHPDGRSAIVLLLDSCMSWRFLEVRELPSCKRMAVVRVVSARDVIFGWPRATHADLGFEVAKARNLQTLAMLLSPCNRYLLVCIGMAVVAIDHEAMFKRAARERPRANRGIEAAAAAIARIGKGDEPVARIHRPDHDDVRPRRIGWSDAGLWISCAAGGVLLLTTGISEADLRRATAAPWSGSGGEGGEDKDAPCAGQ